MMELGEGEKGRKDGKVAGKEEQPREQRAVRPKDPKVEKMMSQRRVYRSMEKLWRCIYMRPSPSHSRNRSLMKA